MSAGREALLLLTKARQSTKKSIYSDLQHPTLDAHNYLLSHLLRAAWASHKVRSKIGPSSHSMAV